MKPCVYVYVCDVCVCVRESVCVCDSHHVDEGEQA